jgi:hypothetical protein
MHALPPLIQRFQVFNTWDLTTHVHIWLYILITCKLVIFFLLLNPHEYL